MYQMAYAQLSKITNFSNELPFNRVNTDKAVAVGDTYYFAADEGGFGNELWASDGTPSGTYLVRDITPGSASSVLSNFVAHKGILYFFANGGVSGEELWRSDGTASGTYLVRDVNSINSSLVELISDGNYLYFFPFTNQFGNEIWKSDGTASGTVLLRDIAPGKTSSNGYSLFLFKNKVYFFAKSNGFDALELWTTDGSTSGTIKVSQLDVIGATIDKSIAAMNDSIFYFTVRTGFSDQLWVSDGSSDNTRLVKELDQIVVGMVALSNNSVLFTLNGGNNVDDIWVSDGTSLGTKVLVDLNHVIKRTPFSIIKFRDHAYILANDKDNCQLIKTDGFVSGTSVIAKFISTSGQQNEMLIPCNDFFIILAFKENNTRIEIFTSVGDEASITPIIVSNEFNGRSPIPSDFRQLASSKIIFKADDLLTGRELYLYKQKTPLVALFSLISGILCFGDNSGELEVFPFGGQPPYSYLWSNGGTEKTIENLRAGTYVVTLTDGIGDSFISEFKIDEPTPLDLMVNVVSEIEYQKNGAIETFVSGGVDPYSYFWSTNQFTDNLIGISSGTYTVTITDINNCSLIKSITVKRESEIPLSGEVKINAGILCHGDSTGEIEVSPMGGISPYNYRWSTGGQTNTLTNIKAGNYSITLTDSLGNTFVSQVTLDQPSKITVNASATAEVAYKKNGNIDLSVIGGITPYRYIWNTGDTTQVLKFLSAANYTVTVTDQNNCLSTFSKAVSRISEFPLTAEINVVKNIDCHGSKTGSLEVKPLGGMPPYRVKWMSGVEVNQIEQLGAGLYSTTITDSLNQVYNAEKLLNQPDKLSLNVTSIPETGNLKNGMIEVEVTGGTPPYTYRWNTSDTSRQIQNLAMGNYFVTIADANECTLSGFGVIDKISNVDEAQSCVFIRDVVVSDQLLINFCGGQNKTYSICDLSGRTITYGTSNGLEIIDVSTFVKGIYILMIYHKNQLLVSRKIVVI